MKKKKSFDVEGRIKQLQSELGDSSDVKTRSFKGNSSQVAGCLIYIEGIVDTSTIQEYIVDPLVNKQLRDDLSEPEFITTVIEEVIESLSVETIHQSQAINNILDGSTVILFHHIDQMISIDTSKWQERAISNPKGQRALQGPDIGFTESRQGNVALVRKIVKNHSLRIETESYGDITNTSTSLLYLESKVDHDILDEIKTKLLQISADSILDSNYISEYLTKESKSIFPLVLNSDRPDVVAGEILEGRVCIIVDGSPFALIAPAVLNQFFQSADDYYFPSPITSFIRPVRFILFWLALYMPGVYVAFTTFHADLLPQRLLIGFVSQQKAVPFPIFVEVLMVSLLIRGIFEGSSRLPQGVVITISLFGAIVFGQSSVEAQIVQPITLVVLSVSFILSSIVPIATLNVTSRTFKVTLIFVGALLGLYGIALVTLLLLVHLCSLRSFTVPYLAPLAPFSLQDQKDVLYRSEIPDINHPHLAFHKEEAMEETLISTKKENDS